MKKLAAPGGRDGSLRGMKTLEDSHEPLHPAGNSIDAGQPIQTMRSTTARDALTALARLLARQAAAEAVRVAIAPAASQEGPAP
jgi:hypothetical protein